MFPKQSDVCKPVFSSINSRRAMVISYIYAALISLSVLFWES